MGSADWYVATMHENGTVRKLSNVYQHVSTTMALPSAGNGVEGNLLVPWSAD